jgi:4-amino-4-deoxy-L-arabinose transferase-like glycosyltransferase
MFTLRKSRMLGVAVVFCSVLWFALLAERPLFDPDEGRYAEIPREMLSAGDWIPHLNALVYLEKPPLQYWITALAFRSLGEREFTARLCTGVAGYATLAMVYFVGRRLWGAAAGLRALLFTAASTLFVLLAHQLTLDMLLGACLTAALSCFLLAQARAAPPRMDARLLGRDGAGGANQRIDRRCHSGRRTLHYVLWQKQWRLVRELNLRCGLPAFTAIAAPWFVCAARANRQFLHFFFVREHLQRFLTPIEHRTRPWWFFAPVLVVGITPWLPQAARALLMPLKASAPPGEFDARRLLWIWCVFVLVFFSCSDSKLIPYILPAIPALALLCAAHEGSDSSGVY